MSGPSLTNGAFYADKLPANATGTFTIDLTQNITPGELYYTRAFAQNETGATGYGTDKTFILPMKPTVATVDVSIANDLATGRITSDGGENVTERGVCWSSSSQTPTVADSRSYDTLTGSFTGDFTKLMTGLTRGTTYYVSAYAVNAVGTSYGYPSVVYYNPPSAPTVTTDTTVTGIIESEATVSGNVTSDGGSSVTEKGICYSSTALTLPTVADSKQVFSPAGTGEFSVDITGLDSFKTYYARAYATNSMGTNYGNVVTFRTLEGPPTVITNPETEVKSTSAVLNGTVTNDGGNLVEKGVCWGKPTEICKEVPDTSTGYGISVSVTGLSYSTTYIFKAYAKNNAGTRYGIEETLYTLSAKYPKVTTDNTAIPVTLTEAKVSGSVEKQDETPIAEKGFCWNTTGTPVIDAAGCNGINCIKSVVSTDTTITPFSETIAAFTADVTYYIRAYAKNARGIAYGSQIEYIRPGKPTLTTADPASVGKDKATLGGNVTSTGGSIVTITARGVCYSTLAEPSLQQGTCTAHTSATTGVFTIDVTGLTAGTTYYVKAYTTSSLAETAYGDQKEFTTTNKPVVTTSAITNLAQTTATVGGEVTEDNKSSVTARGVCWSNAPLDAAPDITGCTTDGTGKGVFTHSLTGLTYHTTYYVKAYAVNEAGTGYGVEVSFVTALKPGDVDGDGDVDLVDAVILLKVLTGTDTGVTIYVNADANGDGKLGIEDVIFILRKVLGL